MDQATEHYIRIILFAVVALICAVISFETPIALWGTVICLLIGFGENYLYYSSLNEEARQKIVEANEEAHRIIKDARQTKEGVMEECRQTKENAREELNKMTEEWNEATKAAKQKFEEEKEKTQQTKEMHDAFQRQIEGYTTEFFVPGIGLLDELAADFSHHKAGQKLSEARKNTRTLFKAGEALNNFIDNNPNGTLKANFFVDYYNDKVEMILSRMKNDNYGQLAQEIRDTAAIVNKSLEWFKNSTKHPSITKKYIEARINELKWATIVHELKQKARDEQRVIQEQIREEAKVQKEIEKAKKEAAKEAADAAKAEAAAQKLYDEFKARFDAMSEKEKALHAQELAEQEAKLADAEERIRLAEEKGQRALSMAQQTKQGHVYVISNIGSFGENVYKIGMTRRLDPEERVRELGDASVPFPFDIHGMIHFDDAPAAESQLHRIFLMGQMNKTNSRKEFFRSNLEEIKSAVEKLGGKAKWTMLADAAQYRETLRIEERIQNDTAYRKQWEEKQIQLENVVFPAFDEEEDVA